MLAYSLFGAAALLVLWKVVPFLVRAWTSPLRHLPGPPNPSWIYGNLQEIWMAGNSVLHERWVAEYGPSIKYKGLFSIDRLSTVDTRAINHILTHSVDYQKPEHTRRFLTRLLGAGILITEGEQHRQQRRIMNPAFGPAQIRELTDIFVEKSIRLREIWSMEITKTGQPARIDVLSWLSRTTLDIIGLAGFDYDFDTLSGSKNELSEAFSVMFSSNRQNIFALLQGRVPPLRFFQTAGSKKAAYAQQVMRRIGMELITERKAAILAEIQDSKNGIEKHGSLNRDLLTLLIKANMATDVPDNQRLSDEDVLAQVPTFLVAGHETTSTATTWCLYALTQAPGVQQKLREELFTLPTDTPTMDELNSLPYLDAVIRETLRVHAPVPSTMRVAMKDDSIPLNNPFTDLDGKVHDSIRVAKGQTIFIPILALNRSKQLWGEDSFEFKPERWENTPEATINIPGVFSNLLSFLGGPRSCIGYRFSLVEMKALVFTLIRAFEFELAVPVDHITKKSAVVQRPLVTSEPEKGNQMPLIIRPYSAP